MDQVSDVTATGMSAAGNKQARSVLRFVNTRDALVASSRVLTPAAVFLELEGAASDGITVSGDDLSKATTPVSFEGGASKKVVRRDAETRKS